MYSEISVDYLTKLPASAQVILLIICQVSEVRLFQSNSQSTPQSPTLWLQILRLWAEFNNTISIQNRFTIVTM